MQSVIIKLFALINSVVAHGSIINMIVDDIPVISNLSSPGQKESVALAECRKGQVSTECGGPGPTFTVSFT